MSRTRRDEPMKVEVTFGPPLPKGNALRLADALARAGGHKDFAALVEAKRQARDQR